MPKRLTIETESVEFVTARLPVKALQLEETRDPDAPLFRREVTGLVPGPMPWD